MPRATGALSQGKDMQVQVVEFYPIKTLGGKLMGTMHVHLPEHLLDIRGVYFICAKGKWVIRLPYQRATDIDSGAEVLYPNINFSKKELQEALMTSLRSEGIKYIEENFIKTGKIKINEDKSYPKPYVKRHQRPCFNRTPPNGSRGENLK